MNPEFIKFRDFLPSYLSAESQEKLFGELSQFPDNLDSRMYSHYLLVKNDLFQGDGIKKLPYLCFCSEEIDVLKSIQYPRALLLSNTCDMEPGNTRLMGINFCYAPIMELGKYENVLLEEINDIEKVRNHVEAVKRQRITHLFYLPKGGNLESDCLVRLDSICHGSLSHASAESLKQKRLFVLSQYGAYLLALKLSYHFCRLTDKVDREES